MTFVAWLLIVGMVAAAVRWFPTVPSWVREMWHADDLDVDARLELRRREGVPPWASR